MKKFMMSMASILFVISLLPMNAAAGETILKLATWGPPKHFIAEARGQWIEEVNTTLAGRVKIVDYPGGQLFGPKDMHSAVAKGQVELGLVLQPSMLAMVPMLQGVYLPFAFDNLDQVDQAYSGETLAIIEKAMEAKNLKLIYVSYTDGVQVYSNKKNIVSTDDFKGLRILSASPIFSEIMARLGAAPDTSIPYTEQYMALQRGVSDAVATSIVGGFFEKNHEVAPYITKMDMSFATVLVVANLKKWKKLPQDVQDTIITLGRKKTAYSLAMAKGWEQKFTADMEKLGATITRIPDEEREKIKQISREVWLDWAKKNGKQAEALLDLSLKIVDSAK
ncbi:TRAP transporter substrate-binding protein [Desulfatitalea tepidiphila]|uniref:TRAP transporter substrate-binding protein n=1 Tax=Desulfatitalea tepidiphila TaxID=1185843 RepID=UPI0006B42AF0|nr:TRAP transporter substrate-binding protein DctP [Desulfatitalea tepidiphila]